MTSPMPPSEPAYEALWPLARSAANTITPAGRVGDVEHVRLAFVWDYVFRGDEIFDHVTRELRKELPEATWIGHDAFGNIHGADERVVVGRLPTLLAEHGVDAVLVGVGA